VGVRVKKDCLNNFDYYEYINVIIILNMLNLRKNIKKQVTNVSGKLKIASYFLCL